MKETPWRVQVRDLDQVCGGQRHLAATWVGREWGGALIFGNGHLREGRGRSGGVRPQGDRIDEENRTWEGDIVERRTSRII